MKKTLLWLFVLLWLISWVNAYNTIIRSPIQFIKLLYVTPNWELDPSKATIKLDGSSWIIYAKDIKLSWKSVATQSYVNMKAYQAEKNAKNYANLRAYQAERKAKNYANLRAYQAEKNAKNYANSRAYQAERNAKNYVDSRLSNINLKLPKCWPLQVLTSYNWRDFRCINLSKQSFPVDWKCNNVRNWCIAWWFRDISDTWTYYRWQCTWLYGWKTVTCSKAKKFRWVTWWWWSCNKSCWWWIKTRSVVCKDDINQTVPSYYCRNIPKPSYKTSCYNRACICSRSRKYFSTRANYRHTVYANGTVRVRLVSDDLYWQVRFYDRNWRLLYHNSRIWRWRDGNSRDQVFDKTVNNVYKVVWYARDGGSESWVRGYVWYRYCH